MKTPFLLCVTILATATVFAQQPALVLSSISTSGSAVVRIAPDLADLSFGIEIRNADLDAARQEHTERAKKVIAALRAAGIAEAELQTSQVQIEPHFSDRDKETGQIRFYSVMQTIGCTLHEVNKVPDLTAEAVLAGANSVSKIVLRTSQLRKYRDEARAMAISAAREKAAALAAELGLKVGKAYSVSEGSDYGFSNVNANATVNSEPGDGTVAAFAPGSISIHASVNVSFLTE